MSESIKCSECGGQKYTHIGGNNFRCDYCGATFSVVSAGAYSMDAPARPLPPAQPYLQPNPAYNPNPARTYKNKVVALVLTFFLGGLGIQWFYLGRIGMGIFSVLLFWTWIPSIIAFFQFFYLLFMRSETFDRKYNNVR